MENKDIVNFSKFFESDFTSKPSSFKKEDFNDFFLSEEAEKEDDDFLVNTLDEIEKKEKSVKREPAFSPPVQPEQFIIDEDDPEELEVEDSLRSYQNKNNFTKVQEQVDNYYPVFKDKSENFTCDVMVEGAKLNDTQARLILESDDWTIMFEGDIDRNGKCNIPIKKLNIFDEGTIGKIRLEVIAENTVFTPWEDDFKVKMSKKVMVQVHESRSTPKRPMITESSVRVKVRK
jgi:hypothetical protein